MGRASFVVVLELDFMVLAFFFIAMMDLWRECKCARRSVGVMKHHEVAQQQFSKEVHVGMIGDSYEHDID